MSQKIKLSDNAMSFSFDFPEISGGPRKNLIKLSAYGVSLVPDPNRPVLLLRDEGGQYTLPVAINPLEAGATLSQFNRNVLAVTPHKVLETLLQSLEIKIQKCVFVEIKGHYQFVRLFLHNHPHLKSMKLRAEEAMSLCLHLNVDLYASREIIMASRELHLQRSHALKAGPEAVEKRSPFEGFLQ